MQTIHPNQALRRIGGKAASGQSLLEMIIGLTVFLVLVLGLCDLGRAVFAYNAVTHCAREGVRFAVVHGADSAVPVGPSVNYAALTDFVRSRAQGMPSDLVTVAATWTNAPSAPVNGRGGTVTVRVTYNFQPVSPLAFFGGAALRQFVVQSESSGTIQN